MLLQDLIDADKKGLIFKTPHDTVLVDSEFRSSNRLPLWDLGQVKLELFVVSLVRCELLVIFNYNITKTKQNTTDCDKLKLTTRVFSHSVISQLFTIFIKLHVSLRGNYFHYFLHSDDGAIEA